MSLDSMFVLAALLNAAVLVFTGLRSPAARSWALAGALLAAVTLAGWLLMPDHANAVALGAWLLLSGVPLGVRLLYVRAVQRRDMRAAERAARVMCLLHPSASMRAELLRARANVLNEAGREEEAAALLAQAGRDQPALALRSRVERLSLQLQWAEVLALLRAEAGEDVLRGDPGLRVVWLRALGECGERAQLLARYAAEAPHLASAQGVLLRGLARLYLFAFTGQRAQVQRLLSTAHAALPAGHADYWRATAALAAGDEATARTLLLPHRDAASMPLRRAVEDRLTRGLPAASPAPGEAALLEAQGELLEQELRYGSALAAGGVQRAPLTRAVVVMLALVHGASWMMGGWDASNPLIALGGLWSPAVLEGGEWWRLLTFQLLHAGHLHLAVNLMGLWFLGREMERRLGPRRLAVLLGVCGTAGGLLEVALDAAGVLEGRFTVGASGAILGLAGALLAFFLRGSVRARAPLARRRLLEVGVLLAVQVVMDVLTPEISLLGHATGIVTGLLVGLLLTRRMPDAAPGAALSAQG